MENLRPNRARGRSLIYTVLILVLLLGSIALHQSSRPGHGRLHTLVGAIAMLLCFVAGAMALANYYTKKSSGFWLPGAADLGGANKGLETEILERDLTEKALLKERAMLHP